jgi:CheY-like chemotaxis protein
MEDNTHISLKAHPVIEVVGDENGVIIVMADESLEDQALVKKAARSCDISHVFSSVYNGEQLMNLLLRRDVYFTTGKVPDLIIMDIHLRLLDGFEVLKRIKTNDDLKNIPIYILTKDRNEADVKRAMDLGVNDYFKKPIDYIDLHLIIKIICDLNFKNRKVIYGLNKFSEAAAGQDKKKNKIRKT